MAEGRKTESQPLDRRPAEPGTAATVREVTRAARNLLEARVIQALQRQPVEIVFAGAATQRVSHGLGRAPAGYLVIRRTADARLYDGSWVSGQDPAQVIYLASTAAATFTVLFI